MLVLTRKTNESIMVGDDIEISVLAVTGDKVRLGIRAPRDVPVFRQEIYVEIQGEKLGVREEVNIALEQLGQGS